MSNDSTPTPQPAHDLEQLRAELARLLAAGVVRWEDVGRAWRPWVDRRARSRSDQDRRAAPQ